MGSRHAAETSLSRQSWLDAGQQMLIRDGIRALRLRPLAASLSVSTGSFYHHFENFDGFLGALCDYYAADQFRENMTTALAGATAPRAKLERLALFVHQQNLTRLGLAMRAWSKSDPRALTAVQTLDRLLTGFLVQCFQEMGFDATGAQVRALIMLALGNTELDLPDPATPPEAIGARILDLVCAAESQSRSGAPSGK